MQGDGVLEYPLVAHVDIEHGDLIAPPRGEPERVGIWELARECVRCGDAHLEIVADERLLLCRAARKCGDAMLCIERLELRKEAGHGVASASRPAERSQRCTVLLISPEGSTLQGPQICPSTEWPCLRINAALAMRS